MDALVRFRLMNVQHVGSSEPVIGETQFVTQRHTFYILWRNVYYNKKIWLEEEHQLNTTTTKDKNA